MNRLEQLALIIGGIAGLLAFVFSAATYHAYRTDNQVLAAYRSELVLLKADNAALRANLDAEIVANEDLKQQLYQCQTLNEWNKKAKTL